MLYKFSGVHNIGHATVTVHRPTREEYVLGFPNGFARSIFTVPWVELGGSVTISSAQTGYHARVEFLTKPFFSGDKHKVNHYWLANGCMILISCLPSLLI